MELFPITPSGKGHKLTNNKKVENGAIDEASAALATQSCPYISTQFFRGEKNGRRRVLRLAW
jgi:hypothetical protein